MKIPMPETGGSFVRDPETGALMPAPATEPEAAAEPEPAPATEDPAPKKRK